VIVNKYFNTPGGKYPMILDTACDKIFSEPEIINNEIRRA